MELTLDRRGYFTSENINDCGDFYIVKLRMNGGTEEWHVSLVNNSGMELEYIGLYFSFDRAKAATKGEII